MSGGDITSVRLHDDGYQVISRSYDDTLKRIFLFFSS